MRIAPAGDGDVPNDPAARRAAVLLVAHGSARSGASAEPVLELADALHTRGFPEVRTAFWKEEPFLHQALDTVRSAHLVVLPVFYADGYFSRVVVPRELRLTRGDNVRGGRRIRLLPPVGIDPALDRLVLDRARAALPEGARSADTELVVLGHGTPRDPGSSEAVRATCARLEGVSGFARVTPAFIDQEPSLESAVAEAGRPDVVVVPFLSAAGFHGGDTVPETLAAAQGATSTEARGADADRRIFYAEPVGTHPELVGVVERLVRDAHFGDTAPLPYETPLSALEPALAERIARRGPTTLFQVEIRAGTVGSYLLRHVGDARVEDGALVVLDDARALMAWARRTGAGEHRPLRTTADLPTGWRHRATDIRTLVEALVALYGPAVVHWHLGERGTLEANSFAAVAARQTGAYADLAHAAPAAVTESVRRCCDGLPCLRVRAWATDGAAGGRDSNSGVSQQDSAGTLVAPCPTPCPILLGAVLKVVREA